VNRRLDRLAIAISAAITLVSCASRVTAAPAGLDTTSIHWPDGTEIAAFENLDGIVLLNITTTGVDGRDTTGAFALDTGAGYLALDRPLAAWLGIADSSLSEPIAIAQRPLPRLRLGDLTMDQVSPVITFDAAVLRRVTDRPVLGLWGQRLMKDRILWIDYATGRMALIPAGEPSGGGDPSRPAGGLVSGAAFPVRFRLTEDGKILLRARIFPRIGRPTPARVFALDTGASKCVLFGRAADSLGGGADWRPALRGLLAPTLVGNSPARLVRASRVEVEGVRAPDVDVLIVDSPLAEALGRVAGEPIHGLLGYSFLRRFRIAIDYPHGVLWLDPNPRFRDDRPYEHSHAGLQLDREAGTVRVAAVAEPSPAERAGIHVGDEIVSVDSLPAASSNLPELGRLMEGRPGSVLVVTIRRGGHETTYRLRRRRLL